MKTSFAILLVLFSFQVFAEKQSADLVFTNGTIITMDPSVPQAEAIAIRGEKIIWLGKNDESKEWIGKSTRVIDLKNTFVFPGLIDSHAHITSLGNAHMTIDLVGTPDLESVLKKVGDKASNTKGTDWVQGRGWDQNDWPEKKFPAAADLDRVSQGHPVFLERIDGHAAWVNSAVTWNLDQAHKMLGMLSDGQVNVITVPVSYWISGSVEVLTNQYVKAVAFFWLIGTLATTERRLRTVTPGRWTDTSTVCGLPSRSLPSGSNPIR